MKLQIPLILLIFFVVSSSSAQCLKSGFDIRVMGLGVPVSTTGDITIDKEIEADCYRLSRFFNVNPEFSYYIEQNGDNAFFSDDCESIGCDGAIYMGLNLMHKTRQKWGYVDGYFVSRTALAHEFAHCFQEKHNIIFAYRKDKELHADFLAGCYIGSNFNHSEEQITQMIQNFGDIGDFNFFSPDHHGTPEERACAFLEGYSYVRENPNMLREASRYGRQYLELRNPCAVRKYYQEQRKIEDERQELERQEYLRRVEVLDGIAQIKENYNHISQYPSTIEDGWYNCKVFSELTFELLEMKAQVKNNLIYALVYDNWFYTDFQYADEIVNGMTKAILRVTSQGELSRQFFNDYTVVFEEHIRAPNTQTTKPLDSGTLVFAPRNVISLRSISVFVSYPGQGEIFIGELPPGIYPKKQRLCTNKKMLSIQYKVGDISFRTLSKKRGLLGGFSLDLKFRQSAKILANECRVVMVQ